MFLLTLIDFAAAVQGFLLAYFLLRRHARSLSHRLLAALVLAMSIVLLGVVLGLSGYYQEWPHLIRIADPFVLLFGPLLYFHVHAATHNGLPRLWALHLMPFAAYLVHLLPFYALPPSGKIALMNEVMSLHLHPMLAMLLVVRTGHMLCYSVFSLALIRRFQRHLRDRFSNVDERDLHRSVWFLLGYIITVVGVLAIVVTSMFLQVDIISANGVFGLLLGLCVYALAYASWPHPSSAGMSHAAVPASPASIAAAAPEREEMSLTMAAVRRPERSVHHLSDEQLKVLSGRMVGVLEEDKAFLDGDLTLAQLSDKMGAPAYQVSEVINRHYRSSFFDAVNRLRVEEVKRRLGDPGHAAYSILGIALDSGFNSKSSFNTAFRKHTGTTPSRFRTV